FTHNATRTDQAQSAMDSLSKSMAKGKIDADAWISIVTGADNVIADMAKTTGKSEAEIRKLGAEGKASLSDLIKTLIATRDENEKLANNMENSVADGFT
ncbi:tape measure protein, partial [Acinetobacter bohemicus]